MSASAEVRPRATSSVKAGSHRTPLILALVLPACGIDKARDDFYEHHVSHSGSMAAASSGESSGVGSLGTDSTETGTETTGAAQTTTVDASSTTESTSSESSGGSSSGAPPAICGNGVPEPGEECDDGNDDDLFDPCTTSCARARIIFLTSALFQGDINTVEGADNMCQQAAGLARLPEYMNYKAIISDSTTDAKDRLFDAPGPYRLVNGLQVARNFKALMNDTLEHPVDTTELGTDPSQNATWTGTKRGGVKVPGSKHCEDWTSSSPLELGTYGDPTDIGEDWLNIANPIVNPTGCNDKFALYCLEQE